MKSETIIMYIWWGGAGDPEPHAHHPSWPPEVKEIMLIFPYKSPLESSGTRRCFIHSQHEDRRIWKTIDDAGAVTVAMITSNRFYGIPRPHAPPASLHPRWRKKGQVRFRTGWPGPMRGAGAAGDGASGLATEA